VGFAILGRGLYDLPTAANKALVWAALSGAVLAIYAIIVGVAGTALDSRGGRWFPWVAAAVVAVSITPLRDALQRSVNRVTYGQWDDPYQVLADLGRRLEASADPDRLLREVTTQLTASLGLRDVAILDSTGRTLMGRPRAGASLLPLVAFGRAVGTLTYTSTGVLRGGDDTLLHDLAAHLGGLLYAHNVTADLRRARERLVLAREEERRRLRRDLHDGLGPALAGHLLRLEVATDALPATSAIRTQLDALRGELQGTVEDVRRVVEGLRPPALDEIGLAGAIEQAIGRLTNRGIAGRSGASGAHGPAAEVTIAPLPALSAAVEVAAYRIVSEAVTNVVRHAAATRCRVTVATDGQALRIEVQDDGGGIRPGSRRGHGLDTMRERAEELGGTLTVSSPASGFARTGTAVTAVLPAALPEPGESA
jgi:signal transduction histidine kinase